MLENIYVDNPDNRIINLSRKRVILKIKLYLAIWIAEVKNRASIIMDYGSRDVAVQMHDAISINE